MQGMSVTSRSGGSNQNAMLQRLHSSQYHRWTRHGLLVVTSDGLAQLSFMSDGITYLIIEGQNMNVSYVYNLPLASRVGVQHIL